MTTIPDGRIPLVEAWVGDPRQVFGQTRGSFVYDKKFADSWDKIQPRAANTEIFSSGGCVTLKPTYLVENTRLSGNKKEHLNNVAQAFKDTYYGGIDYTEDGDCPLLVGTALENAGYSYIQRYSHGLEHYMQEMQVFDVWAVTPDMTDPSGVNPDVVANLRIVATTAHWTEVAPERKTACIRAAQMLPTVPGTNKWVMTHLQSKLDRHYPNPSLLFEIDVRPPTIQQGASSQVPATVWQTNTATGEQEKKSINVELSRPFFSITIAEGTGESITFQFSDTQPPIAIQAKDKQSCISPTLVCSFDYANTLRLSIRWCSPGFYVVESNFMTEPWIVSFVTSEGKVQFTNSVPIGKIGFTCIGMGMVTVAWAPVRYNLRGLFSTQPIERGFTDKTGSSPTAGVAITIGGNGECVIPIDPTTKAELATVKASLMVNDATQFPSDGLDWRRRDPTLKDTQFRLYVEATSTDTVITPYIFRITVQYKPKADSGVLTGHRVGDPNDAKYATSHIKDFNVTNTPINFWRAVRSGSISFTNNNGEWNHLGVDTKPNPVQQAIRLYFKWIDVPQGYTPEEAIAMHRKDPSSPNSAFFSPADTEDDVYAILTGWLVGNNISTEIGRATAHCNIKGRWHQLTDRKMLNSPYYDGSEWIDSVMDLFEFGGIPRVDINIDSYNASELNTEHYTIPMAPAVAQKPQFKFAYGTNVETGFNELHNLVQVFCFETGAGVITLKMPQDVIGEDAITFYDTIREAPDGKAYQSLSAFTFNKDAEGVYNRFIVGGPDIDGTARILPEIAEIVDSVSIKPKSGDLPENFIGYPKEFVYVKSWLVTPRSRTDMCIKLWNVLRLAPETIGWECQLINLDPYTRVAFSEADRTTIPTDHIYWVVSNTMSFNASAREAKSSMQARTIRGLIEGIASA